MLRLIVTYVVTALAFAAVDFVWLSQIGPKVYHPTLDSVPLINPVSRDVLAYYRGAGG